LFATFKLSEAEGLPQDPLLTFLFSLCLFPLPLEPLNLLGKAHTMVKATPAKTSFGTLQNPDHVSNAVVVHSSFSPDGHSFCIVTPGADHHRLRIFDTTTGNIKNDYEQTEGDGKWTCIRWGSITETGVRCQTPSRLIRYQVFQLDKSCGILSV
jgi:hypothetical protein